LAQAFGSSWFDSNNFESCRGSANSRVFHVSFAMNLVVVAIRCGLVAAGLANQDFMPIFEAPNRVKTLASSLLSLDPGGAFSVNRVRPLGLSQPSKGITPRPLARPNTLRGSVVRLAAESVDAPDAPPDGGAAKDRLMQDLKDDVVRCSRVSYRAGRFGSGNRYINEERGACIDAIERLEIAFQGNVLDTSRLLGRWQLIFTNDGVTRSSPFFWGVKELFETDPLSYFRDPSTRVKRESSSRDFLSKAFFGTLDSAGAVAWAIGDAFQTITKEKFVSEVEVKNLLGVAAVTTSCRWEASQDGSLNITVDTTHAAESDFGRLLPGSSNLIDSIKFPSGAMFEAIKPGSSTALAKLTFLSDDLRVMRHEENVYVHRKVPLASL